MIEHSNKEYAVMSEEESCNEVEKKKKKTEKGTRSSCVVSTGLFIGLPVTPTLHTTMLWYCT